MTNISERLKDKVCIVNGAASPIGEAVANRFIDEGAVVIGVDINAHNIGELSLQADLTKEEEVEKVYANVINRFKKINVIYNNMGLNDAADHSILNMSLDTWQRVYAANLISIFLCCKHGIPYLLKNKPSEGSVINSASFLANIGAATAQMAYSSAKAGVVQLTRDLGVSLAKTGVRVNAVLFGPIGTANQRAVFDKNPGSLDKRLIHWPMARFGTMEEATGTIAFLASAESGFITAAALPLDGGITASFTVPD